MANSRFKTSKGYLPHDRRLVSKSRVLIFLAVGILLGLAIGFAFMGTAHAILEIGASSHHGHTAAGKSTTATTQSKATAATRADDTIHIVITSNGNPYMNFQTRMMYASYKLAQQQPGGEKMVGFTRILHRTVEDEIMDEVPTFRAEPMHPECDNWCDFPVADRPNAVQQFFDAAAKDPSMIKAPWVLMGETDYIMIKPLQAPSSSGSESTKGLAFPFGYIIPTYPTIEGVMRRYYPESKGPLTDVPPTGPAPILLRVEDWIKVTPRWETVTLEMEQDDEAKEKLGWVREMYAFSVAAALEGIEFELELPPKNPLMVQPPADHSMGKAVFMHYTWGTFIMDKVTGQEVWRFEKRDFTAPEHAIELKKLPEPPPFEEGKWELLDKTPIDRDLYDITVLMIKTMNKAIDYVRANQ